MIKIARCNSVFIVVAKEKFTINIYIFIHMYVVHIILYGTNEWNQMKIKKKNYFDDYC